MKTKTMIWKSMAVFVMASVVLTSCLDDPEPAALDAVPDVFFQKEVKDSVEMYGLFFWIMGNKALDSVEVSGPEGEEWTLDEDPVGDRVFSLVPDDADYTDSLPETGDYTFRIKSTQANEAPLTLKDKLEDKELDMITIDSIKFESSRLKVAWQEVDDTDAYFVRLYDDDELIFMSPALDDDDTDYAFGLNDSGWASSGSKAQEGETYRAEVLAILYEAGASNTNRDYNIQCISIASKEIVWGE